MKSLLVEVDRLLLAKERLEQSIEFVLLLYRPSFPSYVLKIKSFATGF